MRRRGSVRSDLHGQQRCDHRDIADGVHEKTDRRRNDGQEQAGHGRAEHASAVDDESIERDRVWQVVATPDHVDDEGLPRGQIDGQHAASKNIEGDEIPNGEQMCGHDQRKGERLKHGQGLRHDQHPVAVPTINEHSGKRSDNKKRQLPGKAHYSEHQTGSGQLVDGPTESDLLHPGADEGNALPSEVEAEIPVAKGAHHGTQSAFFLLVSHGDGMTGLDGGLRL